MGSFANGKKRSNQPRILAAAVLDAQNSPARFKAMGQLLKIGEKRLKRQNAVIHPSEFTFASKGAVCALPDYPLAPHQSGQYELLYSRNASEQAIPASVTKTLALLTGLDCLDPAEMETEVTIASSDLRGYCSVRFFAGDRLSVRNVMSAMMLPSSNTAAQAFARTCGEKLLRTEGAAEYTEEQCVSRFISEMNRKASAIGMKNSVFVTPSGLSAGNRATAEDLLRLIAAACSSEEIAKVWGQKTCTVSVDGPQPRSVSLRTTVRNDELEASYRILGGKTGTFSGGTGSASAEALILVVQIPGRLDRIQSRLRYKLKLLKRWLKKQLQRFRSSR